MVLDKGRHFRSVPSVENAHKYQQINVHIQSSAVITRSNLSRYHIRHCDYSCRKRIRIQSHNRHPISRPHGRRYEGTVLYKKSHGFKCISNHGASKRNHWIQHIHNKARLNVNSVNNWRDVLHAYVDR